MRLISYGGVRWEVCETPRVADRRDASASHSALYFLSRAGSRRCDEFPADWQELPDKELCALFRRARSIAEDAIFAMRTIGSTSANIETEA